MWLINVASLSLSVRLSRLVSVCLSLASPFLSFSICTSISSSPSHLNFLVTCSFTTKSYHLVVLISIQACVSVQHSFLDYNKSNCTLQEAPCSYKGAVRLDFLDVFTQKRPYIYCNWTFCVTGDCPNRRGHNRVNVFNFKCHDVFEDMLRFTCIVHCLRSCSE